MLHNEYMPKDAAITVRVPHELKRRLAKLAKRERRSISAQVLYELERAVVEEPDLGRAARSALGSAAGAQLPSDEDFLEVRARLWSRLEQRDG